MLFRSLYATIILRATLIFVVLFGVMAGCLTPAIPVQAADQKFVSGWAWNPVLGWIGMRGPVRDTGGNQVGIYGVQIDELGDHGVISGYSWSSNFGWLCWGVTCNEPDGDGNSVGTAPGGSNYAHVVNLYRTPSSGVASLTKGELVQCNTGGANACYEVNGWAKVLALGNDGWINLNGSAISGGTYGVTFNAALQQFDGWAWNGDGGGGGNTGWMAFSGTTVSSTLGVCHEDGDPAAPLIPDCDPTIGISPVSGRSLWYTQVISRWLHTEGGNLYAQKGFVDTLLPPQGTGDFLSNFHANHLFQVAPGMEVGTGWESKCANISLTPSGDPQSCMDASGEIRDVGMFAAPNQATKYRTALGFINKAALTTLPPTVGGVNAYGYKVVEITGTSPADAGTKLRNALETTSLGRTVILFRPTLSAQWVNLGDLSVSDPIVLLKGSATVVSDGSLCGGALSDPKCGNIYIKRAIRYPARSSEKPTSLSDLTSLGWVAFAKSATQGGQIIIDDCIPPDVPHTISAVQMVGTMYAENAIHTGTGDGHATAGKTSRQCDAAAFHPPDTIPNPEDPSGPPVPNPDRDKYFKVPLTLSGSLISKHVSLDRLALQVDQGSENVLFDGRVIANPPPGFEDLVKQLPVWRTIAP